MPLERETPAETSTGAREDPYGASYWMKALDKAEDENVRLRVKCDGLCLLAFLLGVATVFLSIALWRH